MYNWYRVLVLDDLHSLGLRSHGLTSCWDNVACRRDFLPAEQLSGCVIGVNGLENPLMVVQNYGFKPWCENLEQWVKKKKKKTDVNPIVKNKKKPIPSPFVLTGWNITLKRGQKIRLHNKQYMASSISVFLFLSPCTINASLLSRDGVFVRGKPRTQLRDGKWHGLCGDEKTTEQD